MAKSRMPWNRGEFHQALTNKYPELTLHEFRLMPYLQYLCINRQPVDPRRISAKEREILSKWQEEGLVEYSMIGPVAISKEFYDKICDILWMSYAEQLGENNG